MIQKTSTKSRQKSLQLSHRQADAVLLLVAIIWGGGFIAGKVALETASPLWILFVRFGVAALCMGVLFFGKLRDAGKTCVCQGFILGALQFVALFIQLFALQYITTAKQSFLAATYVLFTPFIAYLFFVKKYSRKTISRRCLHWQALRF